MCHTKTSFYAFQQSPFLKVVFSIFTTNFKLLLVNKVKTGFLVIILFFVVTVQAQTGGKSVYSFMNLANSARLSAVGGNIFAVKDHDLTLAYANPSLITPEMNGQIAFSFIDYFADIKSGFAAYGYNHKKFGSFAATMQFMSYGEFVERDATGAELGTFSGGDYALTIGWVKPLNKKLSLGANLKNIYSHLENYNSYGLAVDVASSYIVEEHQMGFSLIAKNIGRQINTYSENGNEPLPFDLQLSFCKKLEHMPFRFIVSVDNLHRWDLTYSDPNSKVETDPFTGEIIEKNKTSIFADKLARHFVFGGEFVPGKGNFALRFGYDYRRRQEMKVETRKALMGFSWGFGFKVSKFRFSYARSSQHLAGGINTFTITTKLGDFL